MPTRAFGLYAIQTAGGTFDQITTQQINPNLEEVINAPAGNVDAEFAAAMFAAPVVSFTTSAISQALGIAGISGYAVAATATMFFQQYDNLGTRKGTLSHPRITFASGFIVPRILSADEGGEATCSFDAFALSSDGLLSPFTMDNDQTLTGTPAADEKYTLGPATINGTLVDSVSRQSVDFGIEIAQVRGNGLPYLRFAGIRRRRPLITLETYDMDLFRIFGPPGVARSATTKVTFDQIAEGAIRSGTDVEVAVNEGRISIQNAGGNQDEEASMTLQITPTYDGVNDVLALTL